MRFKLGAVAGFAAGYVLGARAGRERYQQLLDAFRAFRENPSVQRVTDQVSQTATVAKERVTDAASQRVEQASSKVADQVSKAKEAVAGSGKKEQPSDVGARSRVTTEPVTTEPVTTTSGTVPSTSGPQDKLP